MGMSDINKIFNEAETRFGKTLSKLTDMKHTEGPWKMNSYTGGFFEITEDRKEQDDSVIAKLYATTSSIKDQTEANAKLIAASPELLAFAEMIKAQCESGYLRGSHFQFLQTAAEQVIQKAKR